VYIILCFPPFWSPITFLKPRWHFFPSLDRSNNINFQCFFINPFYKIVGMWEGAEWKKTVFQKIVFALLCVYLLYAYFTMHIFLIQSFFCEVFFHPIHMNAFYLPMNYFYHWRVIVRSKSPKTRNCQGCPK